MGHNTRGSGHLRMLMRVDGDYIVSVDPDIGYVHRGLRKNRRIPNRSKQHSTSRETMHHRRYPPQLGLCSTNRGTARSSCSPERAVYLNDSRGNEPYNEPPILAGNQCRRIFRSYHDLHVRFRRPRPIHRTGRDANGCTADLLVPSAWGTET